MISRAAALVLGDDGDDPLTQSLPAAFHDAGLVARVLHPADFALTPVCVGDEVKVDGAPVAVAVDRYSREARLAAGFAESDADFAHAEARALLLDLLAHPKVAAINSPDALTWFSIDPWPVWAVRLSDAGVPVAPLYVGDGGLGVSGQWLTWTGVLTKAPPAGARSLLGTAIVVSPPHSSFLWCGGHVVEGEVSTWAQRAGEVLAAHGVLLASLTSDEEGRVIRVDTRPPIRPEIAADVARKLVAAVLPRMAA